MSKVNFLADKIIAKTFPKPTKAIAKAPEWYKKLEPFVPEGDSPNSKTIKKCVPFLDALSNGFIIPLWADMWVKAAGDNLTIEFPKNFPLPTSIESHSYDQIKNYPLKDEPFGRSPLKFMNPWIIETEPGVSCLITSPLNHFNNKFKIIDGIVDTDTYYNQINFPWLWVGGEGEFMFKKGMPLVQIIPFKRDSYELNVGEINPEKQMEVTTLLGTKMVDAYKDEFWNKSPQQKQSASKCPVDHSAMLNENDNE